MGVKVTLKHPIEANGETHRELDLNSPDLGALDGVNIEFDAAGKVKINLGDLVPLVANMAGIPPSAAKKIKLADLVGIGKEVKGFFTDFLPTGGS
jgi:hypothetical protein